MNICDTFAVDSHFTVAPRYSLINLIGTMVLEFVTTAVVSMTWFAPFTTTVLLPMVRSILASIRESCALFISPTILQMS